MIPELSRAFSQAEVRTSERKGDERAIAADAMARGFTTVVAVGGDGTASNIANAILDSGNDAALAILPAGTGNDFAKLLGTSDVTPRDLAGLCVANSETRVDVGRVENVFFLNCCGFGFDVAVLQAIERNRRLRGRAVYLYAALRELSAYRGFAVKVDSAQLPHRDTRHLLLVFANASRFGGAFHIAPQASPTDGMLDAIAILDLPPLRRLAMFAAATRGNHVRYPECLMERKASFDVAFSSAPWYETDGELHQATSSAISICSCPSALRVIARHGFIRPAVGVSSVARAKTLPLKPA